MTDFDLYPNFSKQELACRGPHCCQHKALMDPDFMALLQSLRTAVDEPFVITSGYRCADHNKNVGGGVAHPTGRAVDIKADSHLAYKILKLAFLHGFTGVGIRVCGDNRKDFIHLDTLTAIQMASRPCVWSYS